ncbi:MAG: metabolite traffic protein EboE [Planctomycetota bacterium]|jgi:hypothetical protein
MAEPADQPVATGRRLAYCTNVHAGDSLERTLANLQTHAVEVRRRLEIDLSARAVRELREREGAPRFGAWLAERGLEVFTVNSFPYGDFHQPVVKHDVYRPTWCDEQRLAYTLDLAEVLAVLLPEGGEGSISTLPVGWAAELAGATEQARAGAMLRRAAAALAALEQSTGRLVHLDLEPEPGCLLQRSTDLADFFGRHLLGGDDEPTVRRHLRACHDVCHAAVMFEPQSEIFDRYASAGIAVGKVQVSSALHAPFDELDEADRMGAVRELGAFREPRYLHQTVERSTDGIRLHEDLPVAARHWAAAGPPATPCRVHFHVPIFLERLELLRTTRDEIDVCLALLDRHPEVRHVEVETYAWDVLPPSLRAPSLAEGIARELRWLAGRMRERSSGGAERR